MRVVFDALGIIRILVGLQLQEQLSRSFRSVLSQNFRAAAMHIDQGDVIFRGDAARDVGILAVRVLQFAVFRRCA